MSESGQKAKYSQRADVFRFAPESGLNSDIAGGPVRAMNGLMHRSNSGVAGSPEVERFSRSVCFPVGRNSPFGNWFVMRATRRARP
jgi:hypothetical protein